MFDIVATKKDAATICLHGERVPRDFHPVTLEEILATHLNQAAHRPISNSRDEAECESDWPRLRTQLEATTVIAPWRLRVRTQRSNEGPHVDRYSQPVIAGPCSTN